MIVKKIPILQGFPAIKTVKNLSRQRVKLSDNLLSFYDIETTGLNRKTSFVYLIGAVKYEDGCWNLYQWMCENKAEEKEILQEFCDFLSDVNYTVQYNGNRFDQPYLEARLKEHEMGSPFENIDSIDLYQLLKPCQSLLKLDRMKQPDLEYFLGMNERKHCDGAECIRKYKSYMKNGDAKTAEIVLGHNYEDLMGLGSIFSMLAYKNLFEGNYQPIACSVQNELMILELQLPDKLPKEISYGIAEFYITADAYKAKILVQLKNGKLRQYYPNYKDYDYLPSEDTAIPKVLSRYMDRSLRKAANSRNSYTWFTCSEEFAADPQKQMQYLVNTLPFFLEIISQPR